MTFFLNYRLHLTIFEKAFSPASYNWITDFQILKKAAVYEIEDMHTIHFFLQLLV